MTKLTQEREEDFKAFKQAYDDVPTQDNEGFIPDRAGFKSGWFAALRYRDEQLAELGNEYAIVCHFKEQLAHAQADAAVMRRALEGVLGYDPGRIGQVRIIDEDNDYARADKALSTSAGTELLNAAREALTQLKNAKAIYGGEYDIDAENLNEAYEKLKAALGEL